MKNFVKSRENNSTSWTITELCRIFADVLQRHDIKSVSVEIIAITHPCYFYYNTPLLIKISSISTRRFTSYHIIIKIYYIKSHRSRCIENATMHHFITPCNSSDYNNAWEHTYILFWRARNRSLHPPFARRTAKRFPPILQQIVHADRS